MLGLDICADTLVGDHMIRGISGGQRKRVTTGTHCSLKKKITLEKIDAMQQLVWVKIFWLLNI